MFSKLPGPRVAKFSYGDFRSTKIIALHKTKANKLLICVQKLKSFRSQLQYIQHDTKELLIFIGTCRVHVYYNFSTLKSVRNRLMVVPNIEIGLPLDRITHK